MKSIAPLVAVLAVLTAAAPAQRTLAELQQQFAAAMQSLGKTRPTPDEERELLTAQLEELGHFLDSEAAGDDRWNGRLMLADLSLALGLPDAAREALRGIDSDEAPALLLVTGAKMAEVLGMKELRDSWIEAGLAKKAPLADRMAMARLLIVVLHEVDRGEKLLAEALAGAADDETRAFVRWHRADILRDREDLPQDAGFRELESLADDLPDTYWGGVAADRLRATRLAPGAPAIGFTATTRAGEKVSLKALRGKVVVLAFWSATDFDLPNLVATLKELKARYGERLAIVAVALDRSLPAVDAAIREQGLSFPVVADGKGIENDIALRWFVEGPKVHVIGPDGNVRALGLHCGTADARAQLAEAVAGAAKVR